MSEAFVCDRCGSFDEGKPFGLARFKSETEEYNSEVCEECFEFLINEISE